MGSTSPEMPSYTIGMPSGARSRIMAYPFSGSSLKRCTHTASSLSSGPHKPLQAAFLTLDMTWLLVTEEIDWVVKSSESIIFW
eukprot:COSAG02_NODE_3951_length_5993_cov_4.177978_4_plen_83_part_00